MQQIFSERGSNLMANCQDCSECRLKIALLEARFEGNERREEDYRKTIERWQDQQDKRLDKLEDTDDTFQRDATSNERNKFGVWVSVVLGLGTTLIGAVLALLFSKFH
jgi:hypothetical protein